MNILRNMFIAVALLVFSAGVSADDHASNGPLFYGQSFGFAAEDYSNWCLPTCRGELVSV